MNQITIDIQFDNDRNTFLPGQIMSGEVRWLCVEPPKKASLQLLWYTEGKSDEDVGLVEKNEFDNPQLSDIRNFEFHLPVGPYSFSGKLISLTWALELQVDKECLRKEFTLSPTGKEILLKSISQ